MKNKKINFIKLRILFFGISLLLWNCNNEESEVTIKNSEQNSTFQMSFEKNLNLTEDIIIYDLKIPIQKTSLQKNKRTAFSKTKNNFEVITNSVSKIKTENYQAFTFPVKNSSSEFDLQNFVAIKNNDGTIEYLLINYIKNITKNSHFPYHIKYEKLDSNLNYLDEKYLYKSEEDGDNHSNNDEERECYKIEFLPCGCGGKANGHPPSGPACCAGSPAVLVKTDCDDVGGDGGSIDFEEPPCTECAVDPDGNAPVVVSPEGNWVSTNNGNSGTTVEHYIYEGDEECLADGSCTPPLYIPLVSEQTLEQKLKLSSEEHNWLNNSENYEIKTEIEEFIENNNSEEAEKFAKNIINLGTDLGSFNTEINSTTFDTLNNPWLDILREYAKRLEQLKDEIPQILWDKMNEYLDRQLITALTKTAFKFNPDADTTKESNKQHEFENDGKRSVGILLYEFANGEGLDEREFTDGDFWDKFFEGDRKAKIKADFESVLIKESLTFNQFVANGTFLESSYKFSPDHAGVLESFEEHKNANWVQFFVGGSSIEYRPSSQSGYINVKLINPTSRHSLLLHIGDNYNRHSQETVPLSTITQYFYIKIKIN
ncbi:hypothetical protein [uncultured Polaribacter sp.]|uniref:hypothetical protein n=1 Tax=uncultured Polaribacter sp. TaxID=174711 RepID=UPI002628B4A6|nr:hypothetical protein [uncultured Polaribacter sp.]